MVLAPYDCPLPVGLRTQERTPTGFPLTAIEHQTKSQRIVPPLHPSFSALHLTNLFSFFIFHYFPVLSLLPRYFYLSFIGITPNLHIFEILEEKLTEINLFLLEFSEMKDTCLSEYSSLLGKAHLCDLVL